MDGPRPMRPPSVPYSFKNLKDLPRRILHAPPVPTWLLEGSQRRGSRTGNEFSTSAYFRKVRSFRKTAMAEVKLSDVLAGSHMPPLTLRDFEDYLVYHEKAPENLYFLEWLKNYNRQFREWERSLAADTKPCYHERKSSKATAVGAEQTISITFPAPVMPRPDGSPTQVTLPPLERRARAIAQGKGHDFAASVDVTPPPHLTTISLRTPLPPHLEASKTLALKTFFTPDLDQRLELNLSAEVMQRTKIDAQATADPTVFKAAKREATEMLEESMRRWLVLCGGNADKGRAGFAIGLGLFCIVVASSASIIAYVHSDIHIFRICSTPLLFFGVITFVCGLYLCCPLIWLFASSRQLHWYELMHEALPHNACSCPAVYDKIRGFSDELRDEEASFGIPKVAASVPDWDTAYDERQVKVSPKDGTRLAYLCVPRFFKAGHDNQPVVQLPDLSKLQPTPIFAPVTMVHCPIVAGRHRDVAILSWIWGMFCSAGWVVLWLLLPDPGWLA